MKISLALALLPVVFACDNHDHDHAEHRHLRIPHTMTRRAAEASNGTITFDPSTTALLIIDPQNDFLSPNGVTWGVVGQSVEEHNTVPNIEKLFIASADNGFLTYISPHYYYPWDHNWDFGGELEKLMHAIGMFDRAGPLNLTGFDGSGADWLDLYKPYIAGDNVIITSPHKVYGPETNDLVLQLRKRKIDSVIIAGMSANLCVEAHMRELLEQGFEVFMVADGTAGPIHPELGDGYLAAFTNFNFISSGVYTTEEVVAMMKQGISDEGVSAVDKDGVA